MEPLNRLIDEILGWIHEKTIAYCPYCTPREEDQ